MSLELFDSATGEIVEPLTRVEARTLVDRVKTSVDMLRDDLLKMWFGRAWLPLGYATWDAMCDAEFEVRIALPRAERAALVGDLREQKMPMRAIGTALGVSRQTVLRDAAGVTNVTPDRVTGVDGKEYPASRPAAVQPAQNTLDAIEDAPAVADIRWRQNLANALGAAALVTQYDPDRVVSLAGDDLFHVIDSYAAALTEWHSSIQKRRRSLRVVKG